MDFLYFFRIKSKTFFIFSRLHAKLALHDDQMQKSILAQKLPVKLGILHSIQGFFIFSISQAASPSILHTRYQGAQPANHLRKAWKEAQSFNEKYQENSQY
jgi:hypothetical protein